MSCRLARLQRLEELLPVPLFLSLWRSLLREAADEVGLDAATTAGLVATVQAHHAALALPRVVHVEQAIIVLEPAVHAVQEVIRAHIPAHQQFAYASALSAGMLAAAERYKYPGEDL